MKKFSMNIKAALKCALEETKDVYGEEEPYMISLFYLFDGEGSCFSAIVNTEKDYRKNVVEGLGRNIESSHWEMMYYRYCPEESENWEVCRYAFNSLNDDFNNIVKNQHYADEEYEDTSFWFSDEFDDFFKELEETCLRSIEDLKKEEILKDIKLDNILFQYYVREFYSEDEELAMFKRLNSDNKKACNQFAEYQQWE